MAVTTNAFEGKRRWLAAPQARIWERGGLTVTSLVFVLALALVCAGKSDSVFSAGAGLRSGRIANLNALTAPGSLKALLGFLPTEGDRAFASARVFALASKSPLPNVGALAGVRVRQGDIEDKASVYFDRLERVQANAPAVKPVFVRLLSAADLSSLKPGLVVRTPEQVIRTLIWWSGLCLVCFWGVHLVWRRAGFTGDEAILPAIQLLTGIGLVLMISLRDPLRDTLAFVSFAEGVCGGCCLLLIVSFLDFEELLGRFSFLPLLLSLVLSALLLVLGRGPGASGAKVNLGPFEPVEAIKILLVFFLAGYFARHWELLRRLKSRNAITRSLPEWLHVPRLDYALPVFFGTGLALAFFFLQQDLGPALVFACVFLALYSIARNRAGLALGGGLIFLMGVWAGYRLGIPHTVVSRINMWLSPWANAVHGGDQLAHALWAFSSGGFFGTGLGMSGASVIPAGHTDLILAAAGEELGWVGVVSIFALYGVLTYRGISIAKGCDTAYRFFLAFGLIAVLAFETLLISFGVLGISPLSGVVSPFLSFGRTSMLANFTAFGILLSISARTPRVTAPSPFAVPARYAAIMLAVLGTAVVVRASYVQVLNHIDTAAAPALVLQADGVFRYEYNPRLRDLATSLPRGTVSDRNGITLATSSKEELERHRADYSGMEISLETCCSGNQHRYYPFGHMLFHVLGDRNHRLGWFASNTSFVERDASEALIPYDERGRTEKVADPRTGLPIQVVRIDYRPLVPLLGLAPQKSSDRPTRGGIRLALDARLESAISTALQRRLVESGKTKGAIVVIDPASGELLALVNLPAPDFGEGAPVGPESLLDRARYGLYPPGSTFKVVTAIAALQEKPESADTNFECIRLPGGRVGNIVRGQVVRDDVTDRTPHGSISMEQALAESCNAYFAQLGANVVGTRRLFSAAAPFGIRIASPNTPERLAAHLVEASYGQGEVLVSPLQMARVAGVVANHGVLVPLRLYEQGDRSSADVKVLDTSHADELARYLRSVVTTGTAKELNHFKAGIAGKTGTAEVEAGDSHSWFIGFAPYEGNSRRIAFAVLVENGGYGAGVATKLAGDVVSTAVALGMIQ